MVVNGNAKTTPFSSPLATITIAPYNTSNNATSLTMNVEPVNTTHNQTVNIVSPIVSITLQNTPNGVFIQPPAPVSLCFAVPAVYQGSSSDAQLVVLNITTGGWSFVSFVSSSIPPGSVSRRKRQPASVVYFCGVTSHFSTFAILLDGNDPTPDRLTGDSGGGGPNVGIIAGAVTGGVLVFVVLFVVVGWRTRFYRHKWGAANQLYYTVEDK